MSDPGLSSLTDSLSTALTLGASSSKRPNPQPQVAGSKFSKALAESTFEVFQDVQDLGFYKWTVRSKAYRALETLKASAFLECITLNAEPQTVLPLHELNAKLPQPFVRKWGHAHINRFPYDHTYLPGLYVACAHRGVDIDELDFVLGGSSLHYLGEAATQTEPSKLGEKLYLPVLVPGTNVLLVAKQHEYKVEPSAHGYQFERFATGGRFGDKSSETVIFEHLQTMRIGKQHLVLICAEADAIDADGSTVEIKASAPRYWGTKLPLQLISSGSFTLYAGKKNKKELLCVEQLNVGQVITDLCNQNTVERLERNISVALRKLKQFAKDGHFEQGTASCAIRFDDEGLRLEPLAKPVRVFPNTEVVSTLLKSKGNLRKKLLNGRLQSRIN